MNVTENLVVLVGLADLAGLAGLADRVLRILIVYNLGEVFFKGKVNKVI